MKGPLRHRWFAAFIGGHGLGAVADEVSRLVLPILVLDLTHSLAAAATLRVVQSVPYIFFGAFAGAVIDRFPKRTILLACGAAGVALNASIPLSVYAGVFSLELLYAIVFCLGTVEVLWGIITDFAVVPSLVEQDELTAANSTLIGSDRAARIVGPVLGGIAIAATGTTNAMWIAALAFLPTVAVIARMPPLYDAHRVASAPLTARNVLGEIGEGFTFLWRERVLRALIVLMLISNLGSAGVQTLLLYVLREEHRLDEVTIGTALSLTGLVAILGSFAAPAIARRLSLGHAMLGVVTFGAICVLAAAFARDWRAIVAAISGRQAAWAAYIAYAFVPRQQGVPLALRGRVNGAFRTVVLVSNSASPALLSAIAAAAGTPAAFAAAGSLGLVAVAVTYFSPLRDYDIRDAPREIERDAIHDGTHAAAAD